MCVFSAYPELLKAADCLQSLPSMVSQLLLLRKRERYREREREREREILQLRTSSAKMFTSVELIENRKLCPVIMNAVETSC